MQNTNEQTNPLLSLCMIVRDCEESIRPLLKSITPTIKNGKVFPIFDEIVFVDTGSKDKTVTELKRFAKSMEDFNIPVIIKHFTWIDDFSAARNFSLSLASGTWRGFLDSDDVLEAGENLYATVFKIERDKLDIQALLIDYDYDPLESLQTLRFCRYSENWKFVDPIHERLSYTAGQLQHQQMGLLTNVKVKHKYKTNEEKQAAIVRNSKIAKANFDTPEATEPAYRARLARTIAQEMKMNGEDHAVIPMLEMVYEQYGTLPEGRQAAADLMVVNIKHKNYDIAKLWAKKAGPSYECLAHYVAGEFDQAVHAHLRVDPDKMETNHEGYIYEKLLCRLAAVSSYAQNKNFVAAERVLNTIPPNLLNRPNDSGPVTMAVALDLDKITIFAGFCHESYSPNHVNTHAVGGSEEAIIYLSEALVRQGRRVVVYAKTPMGFVPGEYNGVEWHNASEFDIEKQHGTLVLWRDPMGALNIATSRSKGHPIPGIFNSSLWLHDCSYGMNIEQFKKACAAVNSVITLSQAHINSLFPEGVPDNVNIVNIGNGICEEHFPAEFDDKDPDLFIYSSCPSRGLYELLTMWQSILKIRPNAKLEVYYNGDMFKKQHPKEWKVIEDLLSQKGIKYIGGVSHKVLHDAMRRASYWVYPNRGNIETFCITALKMQAAGVQPIVWGAGALPEVVCSLGTVLPVEDTQGILDAISKPLALSDRYEMRRQVLEKWSWDKVAREFSKVWSLKR